MNRIEPEGREGQLDMAQVDSVEMPTRMTEVLPQTDGSRSKTLAKFGGGVSMKKFGSDLEPCMTQASRFTRAEDDGV
jgi:hypothetical protein